MTQVYSEVGRLRKVLLHRPGNELRQVVPSQLGTMLFEDTPFLPAAQAEHDAFADILRSHGVEVLYLTDLMRDALSDQTVRHDFIAEFLAASDIASPELVERLADLYASLPVGDLVEAVLCGVRTDDPRLGDIQTFGNLGTRGDAFVVDPLPNTYFVRDSSISLGRDVIYSHMEKPFRKRESIILRYVRRHASALAGADEHDLYDLGLSQRIEGGDVLVLSDHSVVIGCSERTSPVAIENVARSLFRRGCDEVYAFDIGLRRASMHLDISLTMVDVDTFLYNPLLDGKIDIYRLRPTAHGEGGGPGVTTDQMDRDWGKVLSQALGRPVRMIPCGGSDPLTSEWELWNLGANVLAIQPGEVVAYDRCPVTLGLLDQAGVTVHAFSAPELSRGRGGTHCMSMPLERDLL